MSQKKTKIRQQNLHKEVISVFKIQGYFQSHSQNKPQRLCYVILWEFENLGNWELKNLGTWELGNLGACELGNLGTWELGNLGT